MKDNEEACSCCGKVDNRYLMEKFDTGRSVQYLCRNCYRKGTRDVLIRLTNRVRKIKSEQDKAKRK